jgi:hypothetical protein
MRRTNLFVSVAFAFTAWSAMPFPKPLEGAEQSRPVLSVMPLAHRAQQLMTRMNLAECVTVDSQLRGVAKWDSPTNCIVLSSRLASASEKSLAFVLAHEAAHDYLKHQERMEAELGLAAYILRKSANPPGSPLAEQLKVQKHEMELEADAEAKARTTRYGLYELSAVQRLFGTEHESVSHPSSLERISKLQEQ